MGLFARSKANEMGGYLEMRVNMLKINIDKHKELK